MEFSETLNRLNDIKYEQKQECDVLDEKIAELEAACLEREDRIRILDTESLHQYEQIVNAIEAIGAIKQKVISVFGTSTYRIF